MIKKGVSRVLACIFERVYLYERAKREKGRTANRKCFNGYLITASRGKQMQNKKRVSEILLQTNLQ